MTAALTRSYENTVQFLVGHRTAAVSMKQTQLRRQIIPARQTRFTCFQNILFTVDQSINQKRIRVTKVTNVTARLQVW